jgi:hypothetical protein
MLHSRCMDNHSSDLRNREGKTMNHKPHGYDSENFRDIFPEVDVWEDGLYVDVSFKDTMTLGFALVRDGVHSQFSLPSNNTGTYAAEVEAIRVGKRMFPGVTIFSDHHDAAREAGAKYIPREKNKLAHFAAKYQKNYRWVPNLNFERFAEMVEQCGLRAVKLHEKQWQVRSSLTCGIAVTWSPFSRTKVAIVTGNGRKREYKFCSASKVIEIARQAFNVETTYSSR